MMAIIGTALLVMGWITIAELSYAILKILGDKVSKYQQIMLPLVWGGSYTMLILETIEILGEIDI